MNCNYFKLLLIAIPVCCWFLITLISCFTCTQDADFGTGYIVQVYSSVSILANFKSTIVSGIIISIPTICAEFSKSLLFDLKTDNQVAYKVSGVIRNDRSKDMGLRHCFKFQFFELCQLSSIVPSFAILILMHRPRTYYALVALNCLVLQQALAIALTGFIVCSEKWRQSLTLQLLIVSISMSLNLSKFLQILSSIPCFYINEAFVESIHWVYIIFSAAAIIYFGNWYYHVHFSLKRKEEVGAVGFFRSFSFFSILLIFCVFDIVEFQYLKAYHYRLIYLSVELLTARVLVVAVTLNLLAVIPTDEERNQGGHQVKNQCLNEYQEFSRYMSHEMRTPIGIVGSCLETMSSMISYHTFGEQRVVEDLIRLIDDAHVANNFSSNILNELICYEDLKQGSMVITLTFMLVKDFIRNHMNHLATFVRTRNCTLSTSFDDKDVIGDFDSIGPLDCHHRRDQTFDDLSLCVDATRLVNQVLTHFIKLAINFTNKEFGDIFINFSYSEDASAFKTVETDKNLLSLPCQSSIQGKLVIEIAFPTSEALTSKLSDNIKKSMVHFDKTELKSSSSSMLGLFVATSVAALLRIRCSFIDTPVKRFVSEEAPSIENPASNQPTGNAKFILELPLYTSEGSKRSNWNGKKMPETATESLSDVFNQSLGIQNRTIPAVSTNVCTGPPTATTENIPYSAVDQLPLFPRVSSFSKISPDPMSDPQSPKEEALAVRQRYFSERRRRYPDIPLGILVVDDSELHRKLVIRVLDSSFKHHQLKPVIIEANDGLNAIDAFQKQMEKSRSKLPSTIDIILMDYIMDQLNGPEAVKVIRKTYGFEGLILGVTGNAMAKDIEVFYSAGTDEVLIKPMRGNTLIDALQLVGVI